jgi:AcrR family transcriptional regulator
MTTEFVKRGAGGRPPLKHRGDVEERLLAAATRLFLAHGYDGTSCDQVALDAQAGKASIYARYANKTALLHAVVDSNLRRLFDIPVEEAGAEAPLRERILRAGETVIGKVLQPDAIALLRLIVTEAPRLQDAALGADAMLQRIGVAHVTRAIRSGSPAHAGADGADADAALAISLLDAALMPALVRALLGADLALLCERACQALASAVDRMNTDGLRQQ